jgi:hypothetical protein
LISLYFFYRFLSYPFETLSKASSELFLLLFKELGYLVLKKPDFFSCDSKNAPNISKLENMEKLSDKNQSKLKLMLLEEGKDQRR